MLLLIYWISIFIQLGKHDSFNFLHTINFFLHFGPSFFSLSQWIHQQTQLLNAPHFLLGTPLLNTPHFLLRTPHKSNLHTPYYHPIFYLVHLVKLIYTHLTEVDTYIVSPVQICNYAMESKWKVEEENDKEAKHIFNVHSRHMTCKEVEAWRSWIKGYILSNKGILGI